MVPGGLEISPGRGGPEDPKGPLLAAAASAFASAFASASSPGREWFRRGGDGPRPPAEFEGGFRRALGFFSAPRTLSPPVLLRAVAGRSAAARSTDRSLDPMAGAVALGVASPPATSPPATSPPPAFSRAPPLTFADPPFDNPFDDPFEGLFADPPFVDPLDDDPALSSLRSDLLRFGAAAAAVRGFRRTGGALGFDTTFVGPTPPPSAA
eukprot:CAMPEP_0172620852 /NCGR_PEP_ID=MMETSP1068-20121228/106855_1 /TAXON_ID=35684 /ORGANISM="Pseudopedinella elastica, Strain CCMP716" /LENGTH=209 /DNA_ID=CAMNT_0013428303 /DNA_START=327 /DNA_END=954 /DNA_ORIENTATION=+